MKKLDKSLYRFLPSFVKDFDHWLLLNMPLIWSTRVHMILFIGIVYILISYAIIATLQTQISWITNPEVFITVGCILGAFGLIWWYLLQDRYDTRINHALPSRLDGFKRTAIYLLISFVFLGIGFGPAAIHTLNLRNSLHKGEFLSTLKADANQYGMDLDRRMFSPYSGLSHDFHRIYQYYEYDQESFTSKRNLFQHYLDEEFDTFQIPSEGSEPELVKEYFAPGSLKVHHLFRVDLAIDQYAGARDIRWQFVNPYDRQYRNSSITEGSHVSFYFVKMGEHTRISFADYSDLMHATHYANDYFNLSEFKSMDELAQLSNLSVRKQVAFNNQMEAIAESLSIVPSSSDWEEVILATGAIIISVTYFLLLFIAVVNLFSLKQLIVGLVVGGVAVFILVGSYMYLTHEILEIREKEAIKGLAYWGSGLLFVLQIRLLFLKRLQRTAVFFWQFVVYLTPLALFGLYMFFMIWYQETYNPMFFKANVDFFWIKLSLSILTLAYFFVVTPLQTRFLYKLYCMPR